MKLVTLKEASEMLGISVVTLRRRIYAGTIPYTRSNADKFGKILLNIALVEKHLLNEALGNLKTSGGFTESKDLLNGFDDLDEKEQPTTMANVNKLWGAVSQDDVEAGRFASDTFALRPTDNPTSETISTQSIPQKP